MKPTMKNGTDQREDLNYDLYIGKVVPECG
jgi:hypothetical protein